MHELAIANSIMSSVLEEAKKRNFKSVRAIGLRVGALTDIVPEALEFGFTAITAGTPLEGASLEIETVPVRGCCRACSKHFEVSEMIFLCPACGSADMEVEQGQELDIAYLEIDDGS